MKRGILGTVLWIGLAACIGVGLFLVKHEVKDQERRLTALNAEIRANQESVHVLRAEWAYLNDPTRLRALAERHLGMHPVQPTQMASLDAVLRDGLPVQPTKLAENRPKPAVLKSDAALIRTAAARPAEKPAPRPVPAAPLPHPRAEPVLAHAETAVTAPPPPPLPTVAPPPIMQPARGGGHSIVIRSPALAQGDPVFDGDGR
ncbi:periplasmic protein TonB [Magnetospirillum fulvum]|uniref:Periplasmic protein TonB n=1 Tax=Magnetospirillum fulvum MGU-K5 TaxID=1316936 RepID=S9SFV9_MAGFU|nr:periplasmic protein TonB [Magnetospirillum fulvum]EPY02978.1 periplasmic protein TonB [Magnetospirillum fulvum MGU-K5]